jgi:hypothetical protein
MRCPLSLKEACHTAPLLLRLGNVVCMEGLGGHSFFHNCHQMHSGPAEGCMKKSRGLLLL